VSAHEVFRGEKLWHGDVEFFDLDGEKDERKRFVVALEIPPVESANTAFSVQIVKDLKKR